MKVWAFILICVLWAANSYGQSRVGQVLRLGKMRLATAVEKTVNTRVRQQAPSRVVTSAKEVSAQLSAATAVSGRQTSHPAVAPVQRVSSSVALQKHTIQASSLGGNTISLKMQKEAAQAMRPCLFNSKWALEPQQAASYRNMGEGIRTNGSLTEMSEEEFA